MATYTSSRVRDAIRMFNKHVLNPAMLHLAGRKHFYAGVIRHTGRRSGKRYTTPVVILPAPDGGFVIPLPYGREVDWLRNVLAAGRATVTVGGETHDAADPEVIDAAAAAPLLSERRRRQFARFRVDDYLKLSRAQ
jgi:deazaflavin-dependent oxidoreductase (nitroreductase family)